MSIRCVQYTQSQRAQARAILDDSVEQFKSDVARSLVYGGEGKAWLGASVPALMSALAPDVFTAYTSFENDTGVIRTGRLPDGQVLKASMHYNTSHTSITIDEVTYGTRWNPL